MNLVHLRLKCSQISWKQLQYMFFSKPSPRTYPLPPTKLGRVISDFSEECARANVNFQVKNSQTKLQVRSKSEAASKALRDQLI